MSMFMVLHSKAYSIAVVKRRCDVQKNVQVNRKILATPTV